MKNNPEKNVLKKIILFLFLFILALVFALAIIVFLSDPMNPLAIFFVALFLLMLLGLVPLLFVIAWIRNENNIREKFKTANPNPMSPEFYRMIMETMTYTIFH